MGGFLVSPKWFLFGCQWSPMSMWTFWLVPTGTPPPILRSLFRWTNQKTPNGNQLDLEAFISLLELSDSAGSPSSISMGARSTGASMNLEVPTQTKSPSKSSKKSLREIGCQWSTLYILYVQIYKHKDNVVSLRMSSSPRISAKIFHQRLLPFVAAISSVFTRPLSSPSSQPPEALKSAKVLGANSIANESTVRCEERVRSTRGNQWIHIWLYCVYNVYIYIYHIISWLQYVLYSLSSLSFARKVCWFCSYANLYRSYFLVTLFGP